MNTYPKINTKKSHLTHLQQLRSFHQTAPTLSSDTENKDE
jgi:hypothetical protein